MSQIDDLLRTHPGCSIVFHVLLEFFHQLILVFVLEVS